ncbi:MAG: helix-turn-helix transcriptional regulator [Phycisphaerae bacterium]
MASTREPNDTELLPDLFGEARWGRLVRKTGLTRRQGQVARLICRGCADKWIARRLEISIDSVRMHVKKLYNRLGVRGRLGMLVHLVLADSRRGRSPRSRGQRGG